jgi:glutathione synthase/RimK-type ligase-like ATP-grasp enzyme
MKHLVVLHPVAEYTLKRMLDACDRRGWRLSIVTIESSTVGGDGSRLHRWIRVPELNDEPADLRRCVEGMQIDAVVPGNEFAVVASDVLARALGLAGNDPRQMQAARDKVLMREAFAVAGVPQPAVIATLSSLEEASTFDWAHVRFPIIVKPVNMAMSLFVRLCHSPAEVQENIERMFQFTKSRLTNYRFAPRAVVEEYVEGPEYSLECVVEDGKLLAMYPTRKFVSPLPSCFETGHVNAAPFDAGLTERLCDAAQRVAHAWQLSTGVMHVELKIVAGRIAIIEAGCRIAGCHISELVEGRYGVSFEEVLLSQRLGLSAKKLVDVTHQDEFLGIRFIFPQSVHRQPAGDRVRVVQYSLDLNQPISGDPYSVNQRLGYCMIAGTDHAALCDFIGSP